MGIQIVTKTGFVFELQEKAKVYQSFITEKYCSNDDCVNHKRTNMNGNYCSECGTAIMGRKIPQELSYPRTIDFVDDHLDGEEIVASDNSRGYEEGLPDNIWLYNFKIPEECFVGAHKNGSKWDFSNLDIEAGIEKFKQIEKVQTAIEAIERVYGKDSVKIKFMTVEAYY